MLLVQLTSIWPNSSRLLQPAAQIDILDLKPRKNPSTGKTYGSNAAANCECGCATCCRTCRLCITSGLSSLWPCTRRISSLVRRLSWQETSQLHSLAAAAALAPVRRIAAHA